jgi:hypothetical protein
VLTRPAPPRCILIPGHCGRCTPSGKALAGVAREGDSLHRCALLYGLVEEMQSSRSIVFLCNHVQIKCERTPGCVMCSGERGGCAVWHLSKPRSVLSSIVWVACEQCVFEWIFL